MKKFLKFTGLGLLVLLLVLVVAAGTVAFKPAPDFSEVPLVEVSIDADSALLAHGQKLVMMNCSGCHMNQAHDRLAGRRFEDVDAWALGKIYAANITQDPTHGVGQYSEAELYRLLRTGVKRDGKMAVIMGGSPLSSERDLKSIIAFLKSDHQLVAPDPTEQPTFAPTFLGRMVRALAMKPTAYLETPAEEPPVTDLVAHGQYLVQARYYCFACHSAGMDQMNLTEPEKTPGYLAGGGTFNLEVDGERFSVPVPSLLADGNLGQWDENTFIAAVKWGKRPSGQPYRPPMHPFTMIDTVEARAMYRYLKAYEPEG